MFDQLPYLNLVEMLDAQLDDLDSIVDQLDVDGDYTAADARIDRWQSRTFDLISNNIDPEEGAKLRGIRLTSRIIGEPMTNFMRLADKLKSFVQALKEDIERHPESYQIQNAAPTNLTPETETNNPQRTGSVFIVHGQDETNLLRLERHLKDRLHLNPIILKEEAGRSRTLIEKFEQEAMKASFAFALLTPDDLVETPDGTYVQSRPNVVFELGWFFAQLGRENVCILSKKGTAIHSDLDGINRVDFRESIEEVILQIERELQACGVI